MVSRDFWRAGYGTVQIGYRTTIWNIAIATERDPGYLLLCQGRRQPYALSEVCNGGLFLWVNVKKLHLISLSSSLDSQETGTVIQTFKVLPQLKLKREWGWIVHMHIYVVRKPFAMKIFTAASCNFPLDSKDILSESGKVQMYHFSFRLLVMSEKVYNNLVPQLDVLLVAHT